MGSDFGLLLRLGLELTETEDFENPTLFSFILGVPLELLDSNSSSCDSSESISSVP